MIKRMLSQEEINRLLNRKEKIGDRLATEDDVKLIREGLSDLKAEHERHANYELAFETEKLILRMDFIQFRVRENDECTKLIVTFEEQLDKNRAHSAVMHFPLRNKE